MLLLTHMPFWVYYLFAGMVIAMILVLKYEKWPTWVKLLAFPAMILAWPLGVPIWLGWGLMGPARK